MRGRHSGLIGSIRIRFPDIAIDVPRPPSPDMFQLSLDGEAVAWTGPRGQSIHWFG